VTTGNLDALRAYTLAQKLTGEARFDEAVALNEEAIKLDPDFAMAYVALARLRLSYGDNVGYYSLLAKAKSLRSRLTHREMLMLDGNLAMHAPVAESLGAWRLLTDMYPDEFSGYYNFGLSSWYHGYNRAKALDFLRPAIDARNPRRRSAYYLQGALQLTQERYADAVASFQQYQSLGGAGYSQQYAESFAAQRRFPEALQMLGQQKATNIADMDFSSRVDSAIFPLDQGQWRAGMSVMDQLVPAAAKIDPVTERRTRLMQFSVRSFAPDSALSGDIKTYLSDQERWLKDPSLITRLGDTFNVLSAGLIAVENGDGAMGRWALKAAAGPAAASGYPSMDNAIAMLEAALMTHDGHPARAIARLQPFHSGNELYLSHAVLMRAYAAAKDYPDAAAEADWLATRRGLAYGEFNSDLSLNAANVVQSDLALLSSAEYLLAAGQPDQARLRLAKFSKAWPNARELDFLRSRLARLEAALDAAASKGT
jgi:tetratricopeptide (TPR) repeat protein